VSGNSWNDTVITQLRAGEQRIADRFDRSALLLLGTTGARTGQPRISPLAFFPDGSRLLVVASAAGRPEHPAWYFNILANPEVTVERWSGDKLLTFDAVATVTEGAERDKLFDQIVAKAPGFGDYQAGVSRVIPVIALQRIWSDRS
jgi:deazaflavin-dependent oxidoreductase (nitroreductase family)